MKAFGLKISRKQHATYTIVDDTIVNEAVEMTPFTEAFSQNIESESHVN
jgi:hypothetical protein